MVKLPYRILDNLPLVVPIARPDRDDVVFQGGYHVGVKGQYAGVSLCAQLPFLLFGRLVMILQKYILQSKDEKYFIHNHLIFLVKYHKDENSDLSRIVGFEVKPFRFIPLTFLCLFHTTSLTYWANLCLIPRMCLLNSLTQC